MVQLGKSGKNWGIGIRHSRVPSSTAKLRSWQEGSRLLQSKSGRLHCSVVVVDTHTRVVRKGAAAVVRGNAVAVKRDAAVARRDTAADSAPAALAAYSCYRPYLRYPCFCPYSDLRKMMERVGVACAGAVGGIAAGSIVAAACAVGASAAAGGLVAAADIAHNVSSAAEMGGTLRRHRWLGRSLQWKKGRKGQSLCLGTAWV
mgnify:CR=1 FL=1